MIKACWLLALTLLTVPCYAEPSFPDLTGRVVDSGNFLSGAAQLKITKQLQAHENATGNQLVVATVQDLQGYTIEEYGYQLGRYWGIGEKGKDNGVLLLVARAERKIRIEVGYGLEGTLTDAISSNIIHAIIHPAFKKGQYEQGIGSGVTAIIDALGGQYTLRETGSKKGSRNIWLLLFLFIFFWPMFSMFFPFGRAGSRYGRTGDYGRYGSGGFGGSFGGGGFSGGGGGFGGGGASGGW